MEKELTYRFLPEYANEKKKRVLRYAKTFAEEKDIFIAKAQQCDRIVRAAHSGLITLDEAMREIADI